MFLSLLAAALLSLSAVIFIQHMYNADSRFATWAEIVSRQLEYERHETQRTSYRDGSRYNTRVDNDRFSSPFPETVAFAVVERYTNQLSTSLLGFLQVSQILDALNLSVAEPFVLSSKLHGIPPVNDTPSLSCYFNRSAFQALLHECAVLHYPERKLYKYREFLVRSSRNLVVVHLSMYMYRPNGRMERKVRICSNSYDDTAMNLQRKLNSHLAAVAGDEKDRTYANFSVIMSLCLDFDPKTPISLKQQLKNVMKIASDKYEISTQSITESNVSFVLMGSWGLMYNFRSLYSIFDPSVTLQYHNCNITQVPHTESVASFARAFLHSLNVSRPLIAIHLRFEQIIKSAFAIYRNISAAAYISNCVKRVQQVLKKLVSSLHRVDGSIINGIIVHDLTTYGSNCKTYNTIKKDSQAFMYILKSFGFREVSFDPRSPQFSGASTEQTFVSLVEQEALTMVDQLVLIGGGRFQTHIRDRFLRAHSRENIFEICTINLTQSPFTSVISYI